MAEPALHFSIPLVLLSFLNFSPIVCILASFVAILPDFDIFVHRHRLETHSFFVYLPLLFFGFILNGFISKLLIASWLSLSIHVLLDSLGGYTLALWPFINDYVSFKLNVDIKFGSSLNFLPKLKMDRKKVEKREGEFNAPVITGEGLFLSLILATVFIIKAFF